MAPNITNATEK